MNESNNKRSDNPVNVEDAFSSGPVTATGERIFVPLRKQVKLDEKESTSQTNGVQAYTDLSSISILSDNEIKLIRLQNRISIEGDDVVGPIQQFQNIRLHEVFLQKLNQRGITIPKPVQMQGIPLIMSGRDIVIHSDTGSGKTLTYILPLLQILQQLPKATALTGPSALVLAPTRELADQIVKEFSYFLTSPLCFLFSLTPKYNQQSLNPNLFTADGRLQHRVLGLWGGENSQAQRREMEKGIDVIVSTPGRLIDFLDKQYLTLNNVCYFVLDEADKTCDIDMENQIRTIAQQLPSSHVQSILCSATFPMSVKRLVNSCVVNPIILRVGVNEDQGGLSKDITINTIIASQSNRFDLLLDVLRSIEAPPVLIFVNSIPSINYLVTQLKQEQFHCCGIHSDYPQEIRNAIVRAFREGGVDVLVCSSLLERGIDFQVDQVIIYEMPDTIEKLKHRAGRTGRAGRKGTVTVFISKECTILREYRRLLRENHQDVPDALDSILKKEWFVCCDILVKCVYKTCISFFTPK